MENSHKCIVFCGWRGSGKDTFSNYLVNSFDFTRYAFADTLKDYCSETYKVQRDYFDSINHKEVVITDPHSLAYQMTPRDLCIKIGKEYRDKNPNYWIELVHKKMEKQDLNSKFVISDCRYPNELKAMKDKFGDNCLVIWIHRWDKPPSNDLSEISLGVNDCDVILDNTKLLRFRKLENIITKFLK